MRMCYTRDQFIQLVVSPGSKTAQLEMFVKEKQQMVESNYARSLKIVGNVKVV